MAGWRPTRNTFAIQYLSADAPEDESLKAEGVCDRPKASLIRSARAGCRLLRCCWDIRRIILPKENEKGLQELPEPVRDQIEFDFAEHIQDALTAAIPELGDQLSVTHVSSSHGAREWPSSAPASLVASPLSEGVIIAAEGAAGP